MSEISDLKKEVQRLQAANVELEKSLSIADALVDGQVDAIAKLERRVAQSESVVKEILAVADEEENRRLALTRAGSTIPDDVLETIRGLLIAAKEGAEIALDEHYWRNIATENIKHYGAALQWLDSLRTEPTGAQEANNE